MRNVRKPRLALASFAAAAAALASVACGLTASFGGLQGGQEDAGAHPLSGFDAGTDATARAPAGDGGNGDADDDAGFCASLTPVPRLCADFDEGEPVGTGWTSIDTTPNATVKVDAVGDSSPGSMLSAITEDDVPASARLHEAVSLETTQLHVEFEMLLPTGGGPFELCAVHETAPDGTDYGLFYKEEQGSLLVYVDTLAEDGGVVGSVYTLGAPPSTWLHVSIDFGIGDSGSVVVKHDGTTVVNQSGIPTATFGMTQLFVALGFYSPDAATAHADFDNVIVNWPGAP